MKERSRNISPDPKELPPLKKRGICIYVQGVFTIAAILKSLFDIFQKGFIFKRKLSQEKATEIMQEVASYVYFETVKQIWEYQGGDLPENDAREVLDVVSSYFLYSYHVNNLQKKLEEYQRAENPIELVSRNIVKIARDNAVDLTEMLDVSVTITSVTTHVLFDGIRRMFELSEENMAELIEDFFVNYYPRMTRKR